MYFEKCFCLGTTTLSAQDLSYLQPTNEEFINVALNVMCDLGIRTSKSNNAWNFSLVHNSKHHINMSEWVIVV